MAKRRSKGWTERKIKRYVQQGRGKGRLESYKPWLTIHDFSSKGLVSRVNGWKTNRVHHFFSNLELHLFYILEWSDEVIDIQEQFPLGRDRTMEIADQKGIVHPVDPKTKVLIVMTSDFLITIKKNNVIYKIVRSVKPRNQLQSKRVIDKLEIEREYWESVGIDWGIVTEEELPKILIQNIELFHPYYWIEALESLSTKQQILLRSILEERILNARGSILDVTQDFDKQLDLELGTGLLLLKNLIARKHILFNMNKKFVPKHTPSYLEMKAR
ncbi:heteromeric transposase endonuclease subunit TnsA [Bacillus cereus]|uniref:TnsA endonuclease N-terminal domain-containing protein n=1 Tax=Bacillus cereus TaxID=1396 RepID=UPI000BF8D206|nr:TnsA endonuclease N-terminal domain-containing protein [Bacillus cereus]PFR25360.1 heteromeric transposase endonuclease subunit TnsA [Bacillus cereus]